MGSGRDRALTFFLVMFLTSFTYLIFPSCLTVPTAMDSSHTSEAMYVSTLMPSSLRTKYPVGNQKDLLGQQHLLAVPGLAARKVFLYNGPWKGTRDTVFVAELYSDYMGPVRQASDNTMTKSGSQMR